MKDFEKILKKDLFFILIFTLIFISFSCKNFITGSALKQEINDSISYALKDFQSVYVKADENTGKFLTEGEVKLKEGYDTNIQFTINSSDYIFDKFIAVDASNETIDRSDCVSFEMTSNEDEISRGVYKATVNLIKSQNNILIKADCKLIPRILSFSPEYSLAGVPQDSKIKIQFNFPVNEKYFNNFDNIEITSNKENINGYFDNPVLSKDFKTVIISLNKNKSLIENSNVMKEIVVKLNLKTTLNNEQIMKDSKVVNFKDDLQFNYRINSLKDSISPVINSLKIYKNEDNLKNDVNKLIDFPFNEYSEEEIEKYVKTNHVRDIWLNIEAEDDENGTGIQKVIIQETLVRDTNGVLIINPAKKEQKYDLDDNSANININNITNSIKNISLNHEFISFGDGLLNLKISVVDYAGNESQKIEYDVIKDTFITELTKDDIYMTNNKILPNEADENGLYKLSFTINPTAGSNIYFTKIGSTGNITFYENTLTKNKDDKCEVDIKAVYYSYDKINYIEIPLKEKETFYSSSTDYKTIFNYEITRDTSKDLYLKIIKKDSVDNTCENIFILNKNIEIVNYEEKSTSYSLYLSEPPAIFACIYYRYEKPNGELSEYLPYYTPTDNPIYIQKYNNNTFVDYFSGKKIDIQKKFFNKLGNGKYYLYVEPIYWHDNLSIGKTLNGDDIYRSELQGCVGKGFPIYLNTTKPSNTLSASILPEFTVKMDEPELNTGKRTVNITNNPNFIEEEGIIYSYYVYSSDNTVKFYTTNKTFEVDTGKIYYIKAFATDKNGNTVLSSTYKSINPNYDNTPPEIKMISTSINRADYFIAEEPTDNSGMYEVSSGIGEIEVIQSDKYNLTQNDLENSDSFFVKYQIGSGYVYIPQDEIVQKNIYIKAKDKNLNYKYLSNTNAYYSFIGRQSNATINNSGNLVYTFDSSDSYLSIEYLDDNKIWQNLIVMVNKTKNNNNSNYSYNLGTKSNCLLRIHASENHYRGNYDNQLYYVQYLKQDVSFDNTETCKIKNIFEGVSGITVLCDNFAFIHTLYSFHDYGDDITKWENCALEIGINYDTTSFDYNFDMNLIPENYYYTTICTFADGTKLQIKTKQNIK